MSVPVRVRAPAPLFSHLASRVRRAVSRLLAEFIVRTAIALALCLISTAVFAEDAIVFCKNENSIDDKGKSGPTSGEVLVSFSFIRRVGKPKNVRIRTNKPPCSEFIGKGNDAKIEGTCIAAVVNSAGAKVKMTRTLSLDRTSGAFQEKVQFDARGSIVHTGQCTSANKKS
jgi:hypothetical protein